MTTLTFQQDGPPLQRTTHKSPVARAILILNMILEFLLLTATLVCTTGASTSAAAKQKRTQYTNSEKKWICCRRQELNDDELIALVSGNQDADDVDVDADDVVEEMPISDEQAAIHVQDLITWCLNHSNCELHVDHLGKLRDTIKQKQLAGLTQARVTDFFQAQHL